MNRGILAIFSPNPQAKWKERSHEGLEKIQKVSINVSYWVLKFLSWASPYFRFLCRVSKPQDLLYNLLRIFCTGFPCVSFFASILIGKVLLISHCFHRTENSYYLCTDLFRICFKLSLICFRICFSVYLRFFFASLHSQFLQIDHYLSLCMKHFKMSQIENSFVPINQQSSQPTLSYRVGS